VNKGKKRKGWKLLAGQFTLGLVYEPLLFFPSPHFELPRLSRGEVLDLGSAVAEEVDGDGPAFSEEID
jgi:hypothetical protein